MTIQPVLDKRLVLLMGKGGVGRTTVAATVASIAAARGKRVLIAEVGDPQGGSSPLAQLFGLQHFDADPKQLRDNLFACQLWPPKGHELFLKSVLPAKALISAALRSKAVRAFLSTVPSFEEMGVFYHALTLVKETGRNGRPAYDHIIFDMPATGHALALTGLPDVLARMIKSGPVRHALEEGRGLFNDPGECAAWLVTLPEELPIAECLELARGLSESNVPTGGIVVNRLPDDPFTADERAALEASLADVSLLGALEFDAIARRRAAADDLARQTDLPIVSVPRLYETGPELVPALASLVGGAT